MPYKYKFVTILTTNCFSLIRINLRREDGESLGVVSTNKLERSIKISKTFKI